MEAILQGFGQGFRILGRALSGFMGHGCFHLAAAVAFYALLSLIPFFFVVLSLAGQVVGSWSQAQTAINDLLAKAIPFYSELLMSEVNKISLGSGFYGAIGLFFVIYTGSLVFESLEFALNQVFESPRKRPWLKTKLMGLSIFPVGGFLVMLLIFVGAVLGAAENVPVDSYLPFLGKIRDGLIQGGFYALPYISLFLILVMVFRVVPAVRVSYTQAFLGAAISTLGWVAEKWIFGWVILPNPNYGIVYGSLKAIVILILWIFFSVCLVLISAEILAAMRKLSEQET